MKQNSIVSGIVGVLVSALILVYILSRLTAEDIKKDCDVGFTDSSINSFRDVPKMARFVSIYRQLTRAQIDEAKSNVCECVSKRVATQEGNARLALFKIGILGESDITALKLNSITETFVICMDATANKFAPHAKEAG